MNDRMALILNWLDLQPTSEQEKSFLQPITNDASQRKYYRYHKGQDKYIVMDSYLDPSLPTFIKIAKQFLEWGLLVPEIYKIDLTKGLVLMSDLGDDLYLNKLNMNTAEELYSAALEALLLLQKQVIPDDWLLPQMDTNYICNQLEVFQQWFLRRHLQLDITTNVQSIILELDRLFIQIFNVQPQVLVHLDYHSRNLLVLSDNRAGILDFQDAMLGPITYDLVSLFQDAYILWPREVVEGWLIKYIDLAMIAGIMPQVEIQEFIRWFDFVGLQRHLKNLGVFARLHHRDSKSKYLNDIPMLMHYILETCKRYPELHRLKLFFAEIIVPGLDGHNCEEKSSETIQ
jgi:hypothetical protein